MLKTNEEEAKDIGKPVKPFKILDIDLDFFLENIHYGSMADGNLRVSSDKYKPWSKERVVQFLETRCGLLPGQKIDGAYFVHHRKLFHIMTRIQYNSKETLSFSIDHIDGHADLGFADAINRVPTPGCPLSSVFSSSYLLTFLPSYLTDQ